MPCWTTSPTRTGFPPENAPFLSVLRYMARGLSGKEIADALVRSPGTVSVVRARLLRKAKLGSSSELLAALLQQAVAVGSSTSTRAPPVADEQRVKKKPT